MYLVEKQILFRLTGRIFTKTKKTSNKIPGKTLFPDP
jgi:hypothetical protein